MSDSSKVLPVGTVLRSETRTYTIVEVLGQGGFGITYHATAIVNVENIKAEAHFAIKGHFVDEYCERDGDTPTVAYSRPVASKVENSRKDFLSEAMHHFRRHRPENAGALLAILDNGDSTRIIGGGAIMPEIYESIPKPKPKSKRGLYIGRGVVALLAIICAAWLTKGYGLYKESEQKKYVASERVVVSVGGEYTSSTSDEEVANEELASEVNDKDEFSSDDIERLSEILPNEDFKEVEIKTEDEIIDNTAVGTKNDYGIDDLTKAPVKHEIVEEKPKTENPKYEEPVNMAMVEQKPQFPGGDAAMYRWLGMNIIYPAVASEEEIQGKVYIQFVIEKDGSITNAKVARSRHQALDAEALRVVRSMPRWKPGRNNGQPVRVTYIIPVTFRLE